MVRRKVRSRTSELKPKASSLAECDRAATETGVHLRSEMLGFTARTYVAFGSNSAYFALRRLSDHSNGQKFRGSTMYFAIM